MKRYVREPGAVSVRRLLKADPAAASRLSEVEVASALVRRAREGAFTVEERDRALASLADDFATLIIVEFTPEITVDARALLLRHRLRAGDDPSLLNTLGSLFLTRPSLASPMRYVNAPKRLFRDTLPCRLGFPHIIATSPHPHYR